MDDPGTDPAADARDALERLLLDGPRRYTRAQVAALAGMPPERTQRLWRALGFADVADDDAAFTDADVTALARLSALIDTGFVDPRAEASARGSTKPVSISAESRASAATSASVKAASSSATSAKPRARHSRWVRSGGIPASAATWARV